jgi:hypothetical protein
MKLVQEGKLSPDDAAELIDAFATGDHPEEGQAAHTPPPPPPGAEGPPPPPHDGVSKEPFKSFVDAMEKLGKEMKEVNWNDIAKQVREGAAKGVEGLRQGVDKIKDGRWGWGGREEKQVTLPLSVPEGKTLRIENSSGDVKVVHTAGLGSIRADASFRGTDTQDALDKAERYTLILEESDSVVLVRQPDVSGLSVDLYIEVSEKVPVSVHCDSGDIKIENTGSSCKVQSRSGDVSLRGLDGPIDVNLMLGDMKLEDSKSPSINVENKSGDLAFRRVSGNMNVRTANGDISVTDASCKTVSLESVSGDISLSLSEPVAGTINIRTVNGDARVNVPSSSDCRVTLSTLRGDVSCSMELEDMAKAEQRITGKLGDGTGDVSLGVRDTAAV